MPEKLFARRVDIGIGNMDIATEDGVINTRVVVQEATVADENGQERELLLIYDPDGVVAMADALREAAQRAKQMP